ncbi:MAG: FmdB family zinc ribbon protein [Candidatus Promineifilaceae bacterium]
MPFYEFRCHDCRHPLRLFFSYAAYDSAEPVCTHCGSKNVRRRIGRVAVAKSEERRIDSLLDERQLAGLENDDPKEIGRLMRQISAETGERLDNQMGEVVERLERGQALDSIEASMPDLPAADGVD